MINVFTSKKLKIKQNLWQTFSVLVMVFETIIITTGIMNNLALLRQNFQYQNLCLILFSFFFLLLPNSFEKLVWIPDKFKLWHWLEEILLLKNSKPESSDCGSGQIFGKAKKTYSLDHQWDGWC